MEYTGRPVYSGDESGEGSCCNKQPPIPAIQHNNQKLVLAYTESRTDGPHQWIFWAVLKCWQASQPFPSCPPPSCGFEVTLADPLYSSDRRREGGGGGTVCPYCSGLEMTPPFLLYSMGSYTDSLDVCPATADEFGEQLTSLCPICQL